MAKNAVQYAEEDLAVHEVWDEAQQRLAQHDAAKEAYLLSLRTIRDCRDSLRSREMFIISEERGKFPDMKPTPFREHVKEQFEADDNHAQFRESLAEAESMKEQAKADMDHHALGVQATTARMSELAGLLHFYSAAKAAAAAK